MNLLVIKTTLKKIWIWVKEYWQLPFLIIWTTVIWLFARRNTQALVDVIDAKTESYKNQLETIKRTYEKEIFEKDELIKQYHDTLEKLEEHYDEQQKELSKKQKKEIKEIVKTSKGNPDEIKRRIQEQFGFKLVE